VSGSVPKKEGTEIKLGVAVGMCGVCNFLQDPSLGEGKSETCHLKGIVRERWTEGFQVRGEESLSFRGAGWRGTHEESK